MTLRLISTLALTACAALPLAAQEVLTVTSNADDGEGSLRAALAQAGETGAAIVVLTQGDIEISAPLDYAGSAPLHLQGLGQGIVADGNFTLLTLSQGADADIRNLGFEGPGGFNIEARGDLDGAAGKGIFVDLRDDQTGTVRLALSDVLVSGVAGHGIHMSDCSLADECGGGGGGAGEGSPASIHVSLTDVTVRDVGNGRFDADGLRVDERGAGDITLTAQGALFEEVGADGVELDEGQEGSVYVTGSAMTFVANGNYCNPAVMTAFLPAEDEGEFDQGVRAEADIPGSVTGSPDDTCIEREVDLYDDGSVEEFAFGLDLDDGFDIDEAGPGGISATLLGAVIDRNTDEGMDFDEEGPGSIFASFVGGMATGNTDDGYKFSEEGPGDVTGVLVGAAAVGNGGKGFVFEEADGGDLYVAATGVATADNDDGDKTGIEVVQEDEGEGELELTGVDLVDGIDAEGVEVD